MKFCIIPILFITMACRGQGWEAEVMAGGSWYVGDLTQKLIPVKTLQPGLNLNVKYNFENMLIVRGGISWLNVEGNDRYNADANLKNRNLNFKSMIWEASLCAEINIINPDMFYAYPYLFAGVGLLHFNPYTYDKDDQKTYLQPLGTEGQGIQGYPNRKPYALTQICFPAGAGWKMSVTKKLDIIYELGYRFLLTDYLDDVSTSYVNSEILLANKEPKTAELAYRTKLVPDKDFPHNGDTRGNPKIKDGYFFSGFKLLVHLRKDKPKVSPANPV